MFKKCVALILLLSMSVFPMKVLAQQSNTNSKAAADIADVSDAQLAGESDARAKIQIERFFTLGVCAGSCLTFVGCLLSATIADTVYPEHVRYNIKTTTVVGGLPYHFGNGVSVMRTPIPEQIDAYNRILTVGQIVSPLVGVLTSYWWVATRKPAPPSTNFVGRSPAYIQAYTDAYKAKAHSIQRRSFFVGSLVGSGCIVALALAFGEEE